jgi:hypothetical protein
VHRVFPFQSQALYKNPSKSYHALLANTTLEKAPAMALFEFLRNEREKGPKPMHAPNLAQILSNPSLSPLLHSPGE